MKIVISATGPDPTDNVDPRFGRARWFIRYDSALESFSVLDNAASLDAAQGAGVQAAQMIVGGGAEVLLTGRCGPKAFAILAAAGMQVYSGFEGPVLDAVRAWQKGDLNPLSAPDGVARH